MTLKKRSSRISLVGLVAALLAGGVQPIAGGWRSSVRYRLTSALRPTGFSFSAAGLSNRFITPNGDGRNDNVVFTFDNSRDSSVTGRIFDLRGAFVAEMAVHPQLDARTNRYWDGRSNGRVVPPGVYIYQIEAEDRQFNGTVVVIR